MSYDATWQEEAARLSRVLAEIHDQLAEARATLHQRKGQVITARASMWEDLPHLIRDFEDVVEMTQNQILLDAQERDLRQVAAKARRLEKMADSPYFGRIDFLEEGAARPEEIYIGIASLTDQARGEHLVYDWRAPISSMFYDFERGPAEYATAAGTIRGSITLKRQYKIVGGRLEYLFDTDLKIDDDILQSTLAQRVDERMRAIVQSIQREQNRAIRDESHRVLIVRGPAGSGKTSVALHRIAFLLYRFRDQLRSDQIVVLSPNELFSDYISGVLPELGEENMREETFPLYVRRFLGEGWQVEEAYRQIERLLAGGERPGESDAIRFKSSRRFFEALQRYVALVESGEGLPYVDVVHRGRVIASRDELVRLFRETYSYLPVAKRFDKVKRRILYLIEPLEGARAREAEFELGQKDQHIHTPHKELRRLARIVAREEFRALREQAEAWAKCDVVELYARLFADPGLAARVIGELPPEWESIRRATLASLEQRFVAHEDAAPLFFLAVSLGFAGTAPDTRHVVIDEAQDYTLLHYASLAKLFPRASFTILGDWNQAIHPFVDGAEPGEVRQVLEAEEDSIVELHKSYRSTMEIAEFARAILAGEGAEFEPVARHGEKPVLVEVAAPGELPHAVTRQVEQLRAEGWESIAVICKTERESRELHARLQAALPKERPRLVSPDDRQFTQGLLVLPGYLAKGLEFDAVILHDAGAGSYSRPGERKLLYTACTRALHRLVLCYAAPLSPLLAGVDPSLYARGGL